MSDFYILNGHEPIPEPDLLTWARWFETSVPERVVAQTDIPGGVVSTVFLGLNHNHGAGRPRLFETMVFIDGGDDEQTQLRCATWDEAVAQHAAVLEQLRQRRPRR
jgi:hypothetical protein